MKKEFLDMYLSQTLKFDSIDEAFQDFIYDFTIEDLVSFISDEEKERILSTSPSYIKHNGKYYFNGEFDELAGSEADQIIEAKEKEDA